MTIFAMLTCATSFIEISTDSIAWGDGFGLIALRRLCGLILTGFQPQIDDAAVIFGPPGCCVVLAFMNACLHEEVVVQLRGVELVGV